MIGKSRTTVKEYKFSHPARFGPFCLILPVCPCTLTVRGCLSIHFAYLSMHFACLCMSVYVLCRTERHIIYAFCSFRAVEQDRNVWDY